MPRNDRPDGEGIAPTGRLFAEFQPATPGDWRREAERLLKGVSLEERLVSVTHEGISLFPIYAEGDVRGLHHLGHCPGGAPFVRGSRPIRSGGSRWVIAQEKRSASAREANREARKELEREVGAFNLFVDRAARGGSGPAEGAPSAKSGDGVRLASLDDMAVLLDRIDLSRVPVYLHVGANGLPFLGLLAAVADRNRIAPERLGGALAVDPLGELCAEGSIPFSLGNALDEMAHITAWASAHAPGLGTVWIHGEVVHEGGGCAVQELAFSLASAVEYLRALDARGLDPEGTAGHFRFSFALGNHFFIEVAKLRAARLLWHRVLEACGLPAEKRALWVHGATSRYMATRRDPHVNMLRATIQTLAGVVGGADSLHTAPFDEPLGEADDFSRRIAMNTQLIVRDESHLADVIDPAGGSWYVEKLTDEISRAAWSLFQEVEKRGGMARALAEEFVQESVESTARKRREAAATGADVIVGTNKYPESGAEEIQPRAGARPSVEEDLGPRQEATGEPKARSEGSRILSGGSGCHGAAESEKICASLIAAAARGATLAELARELPARSGSEPERVSPLPIGRRAEPFESLREAVEEHRARGRGARVYIASLGEAGRFRARLDFAVSFFEVGGFEVIGAGDHDPAGDVAKSALDSGAQVVVICGLDEDYERSAAHVAERLKKEDASRVVALAGQPGNAARKDEYLRAGVDLFIHLSADRLDILERVARKLGVKP